MNGYSKYNLFKKLENEIIQVEGGYYKTYGERLFKYDNDNKIIKKISLNSLSEKEINNLIGKAKSQGDNKKYKIIYFNIYKKKINIYARNKEIAKIKFKSLFNCKIITIN
jgi:hypothetical protein